MENKNKFEKIKGVYILKNIFNYIKDEKFKILLFVYSKKYQHKFNLTLYDYQYSYFLKIGINFNNYLSDFNDYFPVDLNMGNMYDCDEYVDNFKKNNLKENYISDIKNIIYIFKPKKFFQEFIIKYFKFNFNKTKIIDNNYLDIFSPFFNLLSKTDYFKDVFTIPIFLK